MLPVGDEVTVVLGPPGMAMPWDQPAAQGGAVAGVTATGGYPTSFPARAVFKTTLAQYLGRGVPRLSGWVTRQPKVRGLMNYHWETMEDCVAPAVILDAMARSGFAQLVCEGWFDLFRSYAGRKQGG